MSTLNVIGEFFHNDESDSHFAAARDLTRALAQTAPRAYVAALLIASDTIPPRVDHLKARIEKIPLHSSMLPYLWHTNQAARPLDGEFIHALTPLVPLRTREEDDGSQTSVMIPHTHAWDAPELMTKGQARQYRAFTRRALKHADVIVTPTHAVAKRIRAIYGNAVSPRVLPLAAPQEYIAGNDQQAIRDELKLPERYILTNATPGKTGRLEWLLDAYKQYDELPTLVIVSGSGKVDPDTFDALTSDRIKDLKGRAMRLENLNLKQLGAVIAGAKLFAMPQKVSENVYTVHSALQQGVPVIHGGNPSIAEITLDSGTEATTAEEFAENLQGITSSETLRDRISVLSKDRSRSFSWNQTAWQLWEIHANI